MKNHKISATDLKPYLELLRMGSEEFSFLTLSPRNEDIPQSLSILSNAQESSQTPVLNPELIHLDSSESRLTNHLQLPTLPLQMLDLSQNNLVSIFAFYIA